MAVSYIYNDWSVSISNFFGEGDYVRSISNVGVGMDVTLLANASGVTDTSRLYGWDDIRFGGNDYEDQLYTNLNSLTGSVKDINGNNTKAYFTLLRITALNSVLTVGGDYSASSGAAGYNFYYQTRNAREESAGVRALGNLRLVLTAQAGAYGANPDTHQDGDIKMYVKASAFRGAPDESNPNAHDLFAAGKAPSANNVTALGYDVYGTLTVSSDLMGSIETISTAELFGLREPDGDKVKAVDTCISQKVDSIGVRAKGMTFAQNFNASLAMTATAAIAGYATGTVTGNTASATGVRSLAGLTAQSGEWNGAISATATGSILDSGYTPGIGIVIGDGGGDGDSSASPSNNRYYTVSDGKKTISGQDAANVSSNNLDARGIWADGDISIRHLAGDGGTTEIAALTEGHKVAGGASATSDSGSATATVSGNTAHAYGIQGQAVTLDRVEDTFSITAASRNNSFQSKGGSGKTTASLLNNTVEAVGIGATALTLGRFDGSIHVSTTGNAWSVSSGYATSMGGNSAKARGIQATTLVATDNLGGVIEVVSTGNASAVGNMNATGIWAETSITVTGRINTGIAITTSGNDGFGGDSGRGQSAYGIKTDTLVADAFSGTMLDNAVVNDAGELTGISYDSATGSVGIQGQKLITTGTDIGNGRTDAFDINGNIVGFGYGVTSLESALNLRVSGMIVGGYAIFAEGYLRESDGLIMIPGDGGYVHNDLVELSDTAQIFGDIDLNRGENTVVINSNAYMQGALLSSLGLMNIRFDLDGVASEQAVVNTSERDVSVSSVTTISVNLNNAVDGETYTLFAYDSDVSQYWNNNNKIVTFSYLDQSKTLTITGGTAAYTFVHNGKEVSATLNYNTGANTVTVSVANASELDAFGGELSSVTDAVAKTATLSWTGAVAAETYEIEYSVDGGNTIVQKVSGDKSSVTIKGIDAGTAIRWRVRGNTGDGIEVSDWSDWQVEAGYEAAEVKAPVMADTTPRAVNPDDEGSGVTTARGRFRWDNAAGDVEIAFYTLNYFESDVELDAAEVASRFEAGEYFTKTTTANEILVSSLTNQRFVYWRVKATDVAGNESAYKAGESFRIWAGDSVKPVWRELNADETTKSSVEVSYDRTNAYDVKMNVTFDWISATDSQSGVKSYIIQYKMADADWSDESAVTTVTVADTGAARYTDDSQRKLAGGLYDYRIKAVDYVGNESVYLVNGQFGQADLTPPVGKFNSFTKPSVIGEWTEETTTTTTTDPETGEEVTEETTTRTLTGATVTLAWSDTFTDDNGVVYTVTLSDDASFLSDRVYTFETREKTLVLDNSVGTSVSVLAGMNTVYYKVDVKDTVGNVNPLSSQPQSFAFVDSVTGEKLDIGKGVNAPTNLRVSTRKVGSGESARTNVTFSWGAGDNNFGVPGYNLTVTIKGTDGKTRTQTFTGISGTSYVLENSTDGVYSWEVKAVSGTGATATTKASESFTVDATAPVFTAATSEAAPVLNQFILNWAEATDANGIGGYVIRYGEGEVYNSATWMELTVDAKDKSGKKVVTTYTGTLNSDGVYGYEIYAVDTFGNWSLAPLTGTFEIAVGNNFGSTATDATALKPGEVVEGQTIGMSDKEDWVQVAAATCQDIYLDFSNVKSIYGSGTGITVKVFNSTNLSSALATFTVASGEFVKQFYAAEAGTYLVQVTPNTAKAVMSYDMVATVEDSDPTPGDNSVTSAAELTLAEAVDSAIAQDGLMSGWVGTGDSVDYGKFTVETAGNYKFTLKGWASPLTLAVSKVENGKATAVQSVSLAPRYDAASGQWVATVSTGNVLLRAGDYALSVTATGASAKQNSRYTVDLSAEVFDRGNDADDAWDKLGDDYVKTVEEGTASPDIALFADEWAGYGDEVDYRKLVIGQTGSYDFALTGAENQLTLTLYTESKGKLVKKSAVTVAKGAGTLAGQLLEAGTTYYVGVTADNGSKGQGSAYSVQLTGKGYTEGNTGNNSTDGASEPAQEGPAADDTETVQVNQVLLDNQWVGYGDPTDFVKVEITKAGSYTFTISGLENAVKLTLLNEKEKKVKGISVSPKKDKAGNVTANSTGAIANLLLEEGTYYVQVEATGAKKNLNTNYTVTLTGTRFVEANTAPDDSIPKVSTPEPEDAEKVQVAVAYDGETGAVASQKLVDHEWVGYGDKIDYRQVTIDQDGTYTFTLSGVSEASKMIIIDTDGKKKLATLSANGTKVTTVSSKALLLTAGTYYISVENTKAKKGGFTNYDVLVSGEGYAALQDKADNTKDLVDKKDAYQVDVAVGSTQALVSGGWVGFGDTIDYRQLTLDGSGSYTFTIDGIENAAKVTVWQEVNGKMKSVKNVTVKSGSGTIKDLVLMDGTYYVSVEGTGAKKGKNTAYDLSVSSNALTSGGTLKTNEDVALAAKGTYTASLCFTADTVLDLTATLTGAKVSYTLSQVIAGKAKTVKVADASAVALAAGETYLLTWKNGGTAAANVALSGISDGLSGAPAVFDLDAAIDTALDTQALLNAGTAMNAAASLVQDETDPSKKYGLLA